LSKLRSSVAGNVLTNLELIDFSGKETTVVYGIDSSELEEAARAFPWLKVHLVKSPFPFGHHHT